MNEAATLTVENVSAGIRQKGVAHTLTVVNLSSNKNRWAVGVSHVHRHSHVANDGRCDWQLLSWRMVSNAEQDQ